MGWTWLERWMATRVPENTLVEDCWSKHLEPVSADRRLPMIAKKSFDISFEGKESCGSNDVPVTLEGVAFPSETPTDCYNHFKNKFKATKSVSRRKALPEYHRSSESTKVSFLYLHSRTLFLVFFHNCYNFHNNVLDFFFSKFSIIDV